MSANIESMLYVKEVPWHGLGHRYESAPATPAEIILGAELGWEVDDLLMSTELHERVLNYRAIYRKDNNDILGVVNRAQVQHVQNVDTFNAFTDILGREVEVDTAASIDRGCTVFGCFKIHEGYKVLDDDIDHYLVVVNDHLKCDGKVTLINTPIRVVCQNTLTAALNNYSAKIRIPISDDSFVNAELARKIILSAGTAIDDLNKRAEQMATEKVSRENIDKLLDELFPYIEVKDNDTSTHDRANEKIDIMRDTFVTDCLGADNLGNVRGTKYAVLNAVLDFEQHYYTNADKSYDLRHRMSLIPGVTSSTNMPYSTKLFKMMDKLAA